MRESGVMAYEMRNWYGLLAPRGTPKNIIDKLNSAIVKAVNNPEIKEQFYAQGSEPTSNSPMEFAQFIHDETDRMAKVVKRAGLFRLRPHCHAIQVLENQ